MKETAPFPVANGVEWEKKKSGVLGLSTPEVKNWASGGRTLKEMAAMHLDLSDSDDEYIGAGRIGDNLVGDDKDESGKLKKKEDMLQRSVSMHMTPRRPVNATWAQSPLRHSYAGGSPALGSGLHGVQGVLHTVIHDAMLDYRQETKAEMVGLHLDLLRMGRAWRQEMRTVMDEYAVSLKELREENQKLREENERFRRGY